MRGFCRRGVLSVCRGQIWWFRKASSLFVSVKSFTKLGIGRYMDFFGVVSDFGRSWLLKTPYELISGSRSGTIWETAGTMTQMPSRFWSI